MSKKKPEIIELYMEDGVVKSRPDSTGEQLDLREIITSTLWRKNYDELLKVERTLVNELATKLNQILVRERIKELSYFANGALQRIPRGDIQARIHQLQSQLREGGQ